MVDFFTDTVSLTLSKSLDCIAFRHRVIANNIANVETPGFTRSDVTFEQQLKDALEVGSDQMVKSRLKSIEPQVIADSETPPRPDGNNVSIDKEMAEMTKNTLQYETIIQLMNLKGSMIRAAITEGRR